MAQIPMQQADTTNYETLPLKSAYSGASLKAARVGNVVTLTLNSWSYTGASWVKPLNTADEKLPEKYRPQSDINSYMMSASGNPALLAMDTNGNFEVKYATGSGSAAWLLTYLV